MAYGISGWTVVALYGPTTDLILESTRVSVINPEHTEEVLKLGHIDRRD